jgi:type II secretory pathway component PulF
MRIISVVIVALFMIVGCQTQEDIAKEKEAIAYKEAQQKQLEALKIVEARRVEEERLQKIRLQKEANSSMLTKAGITMSDGTITIDTNKTKNFFSKLVDSFTETSNKIEKGLEMSESSVSIDFNKSKNFFESWGKKIEDFSKGLTP